MIAENEIKDFETNESWLSQEIKKKIKKNASSKELKELVARAKFTIRKFDEHLCNITGTGCFEDARKVLKEMALHL